MTENCPGIGFVELSDVPVISVFHAPALSRGTDVDMLHTLFVLCFLFLKNRHHNSIYLIG